MVLGASFASRLHVGVIGVSAGAGALADAPGAVALALGAGAVAAELARGAEKAGLGPLDGLASSSAESSAFRLAGC